MRKFPILLIILLMLLSCGGKDSTGPENNAPIITAISAEPNPVPENRTSILSVNATDPDGDPLSYEWSATAGTFPGGNSTAQVTWIPPEAQAEYLISVSVSDGQVSVDSSISVTVDKAVYTLSGQVQNQSGEVATNLYVIITDSNSDVYSMLTGSNGNYSFSDIPEGAVSMVFRSSEIIVYVLPRYVEKDTTINLSDNTVINITIREFNTVFHDNGTQAYKWHMYGGVRNDGTKYIFEDYWLQTDYMVMAYVYTVPSNAQDIGFLIHGEAAPSDYSQIKTYVLVNGYYTEYVWIATFDTSPSYYWGSLDGISGLPGNNIQLDLTYNELYATFVYIDDIWIFNY